MVGEKYQVRSGQKTVTTAGTRVPLSATSLWVRGLRISCIGNTGNIFLGDVTVSSTVGAVLANTTNLAFSDLFGMHLNDFPAINLATTYIDAATSGDKVSYAYLETVL